MLSRLFFFRSPTQTEASSNDNVQDLKNLLDLAQKEKDELACKLESAHKEVEHLNQQLLQTKTFVLNQGLSSSRNNHPDKKEECHDDLLKSEKQLRSKFEHQLQEMRNAEKSNGYIEHITELREIVVDLLSKMIDYETNSSVLANLWNRKGIYLFYLKRDQKAIDAYSKAISIDPTVPTFFYNRSDLYFCLQKFQKARQDVQKALDLKPDDNDAKNLLAEIEESLAIEKDKPAVHSNSFEIDFGDSSTQKEDNEKSSPILGVEIEVKVGMDPKFEQDYEVDVFVESVTVNSHELQRKEDESIGEEEMQKLLDKVEHAIEDAKELLSEDEVHEEFAEELLSEVESLKLNDEEAKKLLDEINTTH